MDYDDNDFQAQNLHLAGEGSSKFSPVLRPYALPKFDFDDGLQGHLRFDSLVENEVFLGIPSQEDNRWIEDFSRGSSGIEFSSSAAESCSISRRNNVWSEATSSESVEMLLKSVGQEVIVPGETIIKESDACQELGSLTEQMEPHLKQDDKVKDVMDSDPSLPVLPSDEFLEQFSSVNGVESASQPQGTEVSIHGSSHEVDPITTSETRDISMTEINPGVDRKCDNENQIEVGTSIDESLDSRLQKDSTGSGVQIDDIDSSSQDIGASVEVLNNREPDNQISNMSFENKDGLLAETGNAVGEYHALGKDVVPDDQFSKRVAFETGSHDMENISCSTLKAEPAEQRTVETGISTFEEPSTLPSKGDGDLQRAEGCSQDIPSGDPDKDSKCEHVDLSIGTEMHQQFKENMHKDLPVVCKSDSKLEGHAPDVSNMKAGISSSSELKDDRTHVENSSNVGKDCLCRSDHQLDTEASVSNSEASLLSGVDKNVIDSQGDVNGSKSVGDHSSLIVACSLTETHGYKPTIEILESIDDASEPSTQVKGMLVNNVLVDGFSCNPTARTEPDSSVSLENTNLALLGGPNKKQVTDYLDNNKKTEEGSTKANLLLSTESSERENKVGPVLEPEKGASQNSALELSNVAVDQSLSGVETCNLASGSEQAGESLHGTVGQSLPMTQTFGIASQSGHVVKDNEISENPSNKLEVCPTLSDSTIKQDVGVEVPVVPANHVESHGRKDQEASPRVADTLSAAKSCEVRAESSSIPLSESNCNIDQNNSEVSDKPNSTTPTVISGNVLSQSEKEKKEGVKESMDSSIPLSEVTVLSTPSNVSRSNAAKDDGSFRFKVHSSVGLSEKETSKDWSSFHAIQAHKKSTIVEGSPSTPRVSQVDTKMVPELLHGSSQTIDANIARGTSKGTTERKTRRASGKGTPSSKSTIKENAKKGSRVKETVTSRPSEKGDKSYSVSMSLSGTNPLVLLEGLKPYGNVERSGIIPCVVSIPSSSLPDLNTSAPLSALFQQPFTDLQQVQLRAQIFVYGSLIQGAVPDEACMFSAFGASDGGRSVWEPVWRACVERLQGQNSHPNKFESPVQPLSGARPLDQSIKQSALQSKVLPLPVSRASSKGTPPPVVNSVISLSSPLWNIPTPSCDSLQSSGMVKSSLSDFHQKLSPLHSFQTPPTRSFIGHNASWLSQSPFSGPWVASPQTSTFDANVHLPVSPVTETVKFTPVKESSVAVSSGIKHLSPSTVVHSTGLGVFAGTSSLPDMKMFAVSSSHNSSDSKARKRKQVTVSENLAQISMLAQTRTQSVSAPVGTSHLSTSIVVSTPACFASKGDDTNIVTIVSPTSSTDHPKKGEQNAEQKATLSENTFNKVEESKRQAEVAAALAAAAGSHSQSVWSQLDKQKNSELIADVEAKLSSAAAAVAAAASVAKAAAAAAEVASNAALQAKLMADEALISSGTSNSAQNNATSLSDVMNSFGEATSASILKGGDGSNSSRSFLVAAKEAARRRVEAASAASKHAENLDAIVKAAELAAEAVSQAGKIVAMGDPLPLNSLVEAGPDGYWRVPQVPSEGVMLNNSNVERPKVDSSEGLNVSDVHAKGPKDVKTLHGGLSHLSREITRESLEDCTGAVAGISSSFAGSEKDSGVQRSRRAPELSKTIGVVPESEIGSRFASVTAQDQYEKGGGSLKENIIKEGSLVEVNKDGDEFKVAWFSANVLSLMDGKAFVCYTELQSDDGSGKLKEWVALEGEGNSPPRIRAARPVTNTRFEGTRKRRRAAMGDYVWSVGDRVDVWMQDCWREGVVTEKNKKDDTTLTVRFPAEGQTSVVRTWNLRPTLVWNDGEWIEWSSSTERDPSSQGDTPQEKRLKLGSSTTEGRDKANISKTIEQVESGKQEESRLLPLSAGDKIFDVGKSTRDVNKPGALKAGRTGLQKEGSRVIFGVPKPGKKRKFMEVSKHYVVESSSKTNESNNSVKLAKYLMPQGSGSRGWKNAKTEAKEKQAAVSNTKALKSGKPQSVTSRTLPQKDKFLISAPSAQNEGAATDHVIKDSVSTDENELGQQNTLEFRSFSNAEQTAEGPVLLSSLALPSDVTLKKMYTSDAKSEQMNKGKLAPSKEKMAKVELKDKTNYGNSAKLIPEVVEPRRSNRRIQPTSRMLEGLQSSLIISKIPAVSHDRSHRSQIKGTSKGNNHG